MITNNFNRILEKNTFILPLIVLLLSGCSDDFLTQNPKDELSEGVFWKTEKDATNALYGCYQYYEDDIYWSSNVTGWNTNTFMLDLFTDIGRTKFPAGDYGLNMNMVLSTNRQVVSMWNLNYEKISKMNYFLDNIEKVDMDESKKMEMMAEVRFMRAYSYFYLGQYFGPVPLSKTTLTFEEANSVSQATSEEIVDFTLDELTAAAQHLPVRRPEAEKGRIEKGAALAIKGRLLMAEQRWSEATDTYKQLIDLNRYIIDPRFKRLFEVEGENSDEIIFAAVHLEDYFGEKMTQKVMPPSVFGGNNHTQFFKEFVDKFLMIDGKSIEESPLYDPQNPFDNRDPRLYETVFLPEYSVWRGKVYQGHPDKLTAAGQTGPGLTGYAPKKFYDEDYTGDIWNYGGDFPLIRYAEVLLSYLESKLEAGDAITQSLLDNTINKVRGREEVNMAPVSETNPAKLREIIRNERVVELALEGLRYWDLRRWGIAHILLNGDFHGMKITDDPASYTGKYIINDEGYLYSCTRIFYDYNYLWAIPQAELNVNKNLKQNPGYN